MNHILNSNAIKNIIMEVYSNNWNTDQAIRYVVVSISRLVKRDPNFFLLDDNQKLETFLNMSYQKDFPFVICKTLHELIRDVLQILGIESRVLVATNTRVPLYALIAEGEHNRYYIDALHDLFRSQYNIEPVSYGAYIRSKTNILDRDELQLVDLPLPYIRELDLSTGIIEKEYFSDYINRIKTNYTDRNKAKELFKAQDSYELINKKVQEISDKFLNVYPVDGPIERVGLHVYLRSNLFNRTERANFRVSVRVDEPGNPVVLNITLGKYHVTYQEVLYNNKYSLEETTEAITPRTF